MIDPAKLTYTIENHSIRFSDGVIYPVQLFAEVACESSVDRAKIHAVMKKFKGALTPYEVRPQYHAPGLAAALQRTKHYQAQ
jgi:hypothetical protein